MKPLRPSPVDPLAGLGFEYFLLIAEVTLGIFIGLLFALWFEWLIEVTKCG